MDIARFNFSHGDHEEQAGRFALVKSVREEINKPIATLLDTKGPEIRTGVLKDDKKVTLKEGQKFTLTTRDIVGDDTIDMITYAGLPADVANGNTILIDDGLIELRVEEVVDGTDIVCTVINGGELGSKKGVNVPNVSIKLPGITDKDKDDIIFGIEQGFDFIAASFVRNAACIQEIKQLLWEHGADIPVIAKIENAEGIENLDEIIKVADGIMVARGDLGIEMSPEEVPIVQKYIVDQTIRERKVCIVATQMLESMIENPIPTRAEASDVANAILDGTDAIMLSGETAMGKHPVEAVKMMRKIATNVEDCNFCLSNLDLEMNDKYDLSPQAISNAAVKMAQDLNAKAILAFTHTGYTPKLLSKLRPTVPVIAISDMESTCRRLSLYWDIVADYKQWDTVLDADLLEKIDEYILTRTDYKKGERIIIIGSIPKLITGRTNFIRVHRIGAPMER